MTFRYRRVIFPVAAVVAVLLLASTLSPVLSPVLFAMLLAVILNPAVEAAQRFRMPRVATVAILYVLIILGVVASGTGLGRQFTALSQALVGEAFYGDLDGNGLINLGDDVARQDEFDDRNGNGVWDGGALVSLKRLINRERSRFAVGVWGDVVNEVGSGVLDLLGRLAAPATGMIASGLDTVAQWAGGFLQLLTLLVLIPFYLFFFLVEYPAMSRRLHDLVPARHRDQVDRIARDIGQELVAFLRGRLACGLIKAAMLWAGMLAIGIEFALPIALVSGLLSLVPFLGFLAGVVPASVIALTMPDGGTNTLVLVVALFTAAEAVEGAVLFPLVLGKETGLHPVTLVVVLLAGGALMGTLGVLVAIPLSLICKVLWRELGLPFYTEWADPDGDEEAEEDGEPAAQPAEASPPAGA